MSRVKSWAARAARSLSTHLDRLRETLDQLHGRLREAVAEAVSGRAAVAVKDAVAAAMLEHDVPPAYESQSYRPGSRSYGSSPYRESAYWPDRNEDPYRPSWQRDPYDDDDPDRYEREERVENVSAKSTPNASPEVVGRRWGQAIAVGCQAASWWLRRKNSGRYSTLAALGVGAAAGVTAYFAGPLIVTAAGLVGSTLGLTALSDAARRGAAMLFGVGSS